MAKRHITNFFNEEDLSHLHFTQQVWDVEPEPEVQVIVSEEKAQRSWRHSLNTCRKFAWGKRNPECSLRQINFDIEMISGGYQEAHAGVERVISVGTRRNRVRWDLE